MRYALVLSLLVACAKPHAPRPFPALPDTIYTASGATPVIQVDDIMGPDTAQTIIGRYEFLRRRILLSRKVESAWAVRKVLEHERCHVVMMETGLANHFREVPWLVELICDAFANARMSELERTP